MTTWKDLKQVRPRAYSKGRPAGKPRVIYVHYTAGAEGPTSAEDGARYDQRRTDGTSAHYYVDSNSVVQCVPTEHRSHTALYNANLTGIHYELCGTVQTRAQWLDAASRATLRNAARQIARDLKDNGIPATRLVGRQVRAGRGIAGHVDATRGWPEDRGTHTDPGTAFPWDILLADVKAELAKLNPPPPKKETPVATYGPEVDLAISRAQQSMHMLHGLPIEKPISERTVPSMAPGGKPYVVVMADVLKRLDAAEAEIARLKAGAS